MTENGDFWPLSVKVFTQSNSNVVCTRIGWVFRIESLLGHTGQISSFYWPQNDINWWFLTVIWKKYSHNTMQPWCLHLLGECSQLIRFCVTLATFWPSSGHKMTEKGDFRPLSEKVLSCGMRITQSISDMVFTLVRGVFTNDFILAPLVAIYVFQFRLIRPQAGTCILWCLVFYF